MRVYYYVLKYLRKFHICYKKRLNPKLIFLCDIQDFTAIPTSTHFPHPMGIVIRDMITFGENCEILHNVTIGRRNFNDLNSKISIGNNVFFGAGCTVVADNLKIGDNVKIGAGATVLVDVPAGATVTGIWK